MVKLFNDTFGTEFGYRCCSRRGGCLRGNDADFGMALIYQKAKP
jgi:hypothetical protein